MNWVNGIEIGGSRMIEMVIAGATISLISFVVGAACAVISGLTMRDFKD